jgi:hypothetical protein
MPTPLRAVYKLSKVWTKVCVCVTMNLASKLSLELLQLGLLLLVLFEERFEDLLELRFDRRERVEKSLLAAVDRLAGERERVGCDTYAFKIRLQRRKHFFHRPFDEHASDESEAFAIRVGFGCFTQGVDDQSVCAKSKGKGLGQLEQRNMDT